MATMRSAPLSAIRVSAVIPALNAAGTLGATIEAIAWAAEIIVVDGGSTDGTADAAALLGARVVEAPRGRGTQLAAGVAAASHDWVLLVHADTRLGPGAEAAVRTHMARAPHLAAYCRFTLDSADPRARRLERLVAWRCRVLALPYGDQALLIHRGPAARRWRYPSLTVDGRRGPDPPSRTPAAGRCWTPPRSPRRRSGSAMAGCAGLSAICAAWVCGLPACRHIASRACIEAGRARVTPVIAS